MSVRNSILYEAVCRMSRAPAACVPACAARGRGARARARGDVRGRGRGGAASPRRRPARPAERPAATSTHVALMLRTSQV